MQGELKLSSEEIRLINAYRKTANGTDRQLIIDHAEMMSRLSAEKAAKSYSKTDNVIKLKIRNA